MAYLPEILTRDETAPEGYHVIGYGKIHTFKKAYEFITNPPAKIWKSIKAEDLLVLRDSVSGRVLMFSCFDGTLLWPVTSSTMHDETTPDIGRVIDFYENDENDKFGAFINLDHARLILCAVAIVRNAVLKNMNQRTEIAGLLADLNAIENHAKANFQNSLTLRNSLHVYHAEALTSTDSKYAYALYYLIASTANLTFYRHITISLKQHQSLRESSNIFRAHFTLPECVFIAFVH